MALIKSPMIDKIEIRGLFSTFDYSIEIPAKGQIKILTGPNGYGKTTILSIVDALCSLDLLYFYTVPFKLIKVYYEGRYELSIVSKNQKDDLSEDDLMELHPKIDFILKEVKAFEDQQEETKTLVLETNWETISEIHERLFPSHGDALEKDDQVFMISPKDLCTKDNYYPAQRREVILKDIVESKKTNSAFWIILKSLSVNAKFIPAQRLVSNLNKRSFEIQRVAKELSSYLRLNHYKFLSNSQSHDEKFIMRLMNDEGRIDENDYLEKVERISSKIMEAKYFDLTGNFYLPSYSETKSEILKSYIEDLDEKISSLNTPIKKLNLFAKLLTRKGFVGKEMSFSRKDGIQFISHYDQTVIPLTVLSSGEINQIIMLYEFIFNIEDNSILMIDEPEISLHVVWQHEFMNDITEICEEKNLSVLIATHSPQIIGSRWEECLDLYALTNSQSL